jgi:hypothetical protein
MEVVVRIRVLGICQVGGLARCLGAMLPDAQVEPLFVSDPAAFDVSSIADESSILLLHSSHKETIGRSELVKTSEIIYWPNVYFPGYHPDLVYARVGNECWLKSPLGEYNSSLVLYGWLNDLTVAHTIRLFCADVYERLGFYEYWKSSRQWILEEFQHTGLSFEVDMDRLSSAGCFMHSINHPKLRTLSVVAKLLAEKMGLKPATKNPHEFLYDNLADSPVWPVYPEIGERLGTEGEYAFKQGADAREDRKLSILSLERFVELSFEQYDAQAKRDEVSCDRLCSQKQLYGDVEALAGAPPRARKRNPYSRLPDYCFWRKSVEAVPISEVDPVVGAKFKISTQERIATAGSCFAQHIARTLAREGYNYFVAESAPSGMTPEEASERGYGVFSARYGNVYTMRQMVQLIDRAYGQFAPVDDTWQRPDGTYADPFRPLIEPRGFLTPGAVVAAREEHFAAVQRVLELSSVFVFTLGLTEAWRSKSDGAVFPLAPGVAGGDPDNDRYEFVNFTMADVEDDIKAFIARLRALNPNARVILTVSPVPLVATYEPRHVLVSTAYSKSVLRTAVESVVRRHDFVDYFPSFEIVTGSFNHGQYFERDARSVKPEGVDHVMRLFKKHYLEPSDANDALQREISMGARIVCDEEALISAATAPGVASRVIP